MLIPYPTYRVLVGTPATISLSILDQDGGLNSTAGAVTYGINRADSTVLVAAGASATVVSGVATLSLTAAQLATLDTLLVTWTTGGQVVATTYVDVVGAYWATLEEIRRSDPSIETNPQRYPNERIVSVRAQAEAMFEQVCKRSFVPRFRRDRLDGTGTDRMVLPTWDLRRLRSVQQWIGVVAQPVWTQTELDSVFPTKSGVAARTDGWVWIQGNDNTLVSWEYGLDAPPADLKAAFLRWMRHQLNATASGIPDRATSVIDGPGGNQFRIATPGVGRNSFTGVPEVDEVLARYARIEVGAA
jgi:hypothetical protein